MWRDTPYRPTRLVISQSSENRENDHRQLADLNLIQSANDQKQVILFGQNQTINDSPKHVPVSQILLLEALNTELVNITNLPWTTLADISFLFLN